MRFNFRFSVLIILSILSVSCQDYYSRKSHKRTTELQKELFVETFTIFGSGAYGTDVVTQYLTDSIEFRKYIGTFDEGNEFYYLFRVRIITQERAISEQQNCKKTYS